MEFEITRDRTNFIDVQNIYLEVKCQFLNADDTVLTYHATNGDQTDKPSFLKNTFLLLFSHCTVTENGIKMPSANGN